MIVKYIGFVGVLFCAAAVAQPAHTFKVEEVVDSTSGKLWGTLLVPAKSTTVILFVAGSGPTDRDGNSGQLATNCTKLLAEDLAARGMASLRFDKRGVGQSKVANLKEEDIVFETMIEDVQRWIRWLRQSKRFKNIIIAGHSEGSLVGMVAAQREKVEGFVSLAGAGRRIDVIIKEQVARNPNNTPEIMQQIDSTFARLAAGKKVDEIPPYLMSLFRPSVQPFMISWMKYDPAIEIKKLTIPVLIVQGTTDIQVSLADSERLKSAAPKASYKLVEGMNHIFKDAPNDQTLNIATYRKPELPLSAELAPSIIQFINTL
jgi:uncharacterized protein